jgi:hypothetical protein
VISDTAASFIVLQKQFASALWVVLPTIIVFKLLLSSITAQGGQGIISLAKGCFYSVIVLVIFNYFYPEFIGVIDQYIDIQPVSFKSETFSDMVWNLIGDYGISFFAILAHAASTSLMMLLLTIVTVSFSISYALFAVFNFDGLWKITVKCALGVILWAGTMYFIRFEVSESGGITDENAASYFSSIFGAACLSIITMSLAFKYNSLVRSAKDYAEQFSQRLDYNQKKEAAQRGIGDGNVSTDEYGRAVFKNDYGDPTGDAVREHQNALIYQNPEEAKRFGLKGNNWKNFEDEVRGKKDFSKRLNTTSKHTIDDQNKHGSESSLISSENFFPGPQKISLPEVNNRNGFRKNTKDSKPDYKRNSDLNFKGKAEYHQVKSKMRNKEPKSSHVKDESTENRGLKNPKVKTNYLDYLSSEDKKELKINNPGEAAHDKT